MEKEIKINVVNSLDDYQKVVAIRSIVFVGEQKLPYSVEFGTNELCCTYILATVNGEPAGTVLQRKQKQKIISAQISFLCNFLWFLD